MAGCLGICTTFRADVGASPVPREGDLVKDRARSPQQIQLSVFDGTLGALPAVSGGSFEFFRREECLNVSSKPTVSAPSPRIAMRSVQDVPYLEPRDGHLFGLQEVWFFCLIIVIILPCCSLAALGSVWNLLFMAPSPASRNRHTINRRRTGVCHNG